MGSGGQRWGRIKLACPKVVGDPAAVTWTEFGETYAVLAKAAFSKYTFYDWHRAMCVFEDTVQPRTVCDLTLDALNQFEDRICEGDFGKFRVENMMSRLRHLISWGCEAGYLKREAFGISADYRWPVKAKGAWTAKLSSEGEAAA